MTTDVSTVQQRSLRALRWLRRHLVPSEDTNDKTPQFDSFSAAWPKAYIGVDSSEAFVDLAHTVRLRGFRSVEDAERTLGKAGMIEVIDETIQRLESET
jgi:hypothetical protein